jgi:hypothetical protein
MKLLDRLLRRLLRRKTGPFVVLIPQGGAGLFQVPLGLKKPVF